MKRNTAHDISYGMMEFDDEFNPDFWKIDLSECSVSHPTGWKFIFYLENDRLVGECINMPASCIDDDMQQADITMSATECYMDALKKRH